MIYINEKTRAWSIPYGEEVIGAKDDNGVGSKKIEMPRYTEGGADKGSDNANVYVVFRDAKGRYSHDDVNVTSNDTNIIVEWSIGEDDTKADGVGTACVCIEWADSGNSVWKSGLGQFKVVRSHNIADGVEMPEDEDTWKDFIRGELSPVNAAVSSIRDRVEALEQNGGGSGDGSSYVLPMASNSTLGGVKAGAATNDDNTPVRISGDGYLRVHTRTDAEINGLVDVAVSELKEELNSIDERVTIIEQTGGGEGGGTVNGITQAQADARYVQKVNGKTLSTNDYDATAKAKVDAIPTNPKYTDTIYDDSELRAEIDDLKEDIPTTKDIQDIVNAMFTNGNGVSF